MVEHPEDINTPLPGFMQMVTTSLFQRRTTAASGFVGDNTNKGKALAGLNISYLFNVSYSYDLGISGIQQFNKGSHEIVLGLLLNNRYKVPCPQNQF